jgi:hypothetical protein
VKYVEWVQRVLGAIDDETKRIGHNARMAGVPLAGLASRLGLDVDGLAAGFHESPEREALINGISDLVNMGAAEWSPEYLGVTLTQNGLLAAKTSLRAAWRQIMSEIYVDDEQLAFLTEVAETSEDRRDKYTRLRSLFAQDVFKALGWDPGDFGRLYDVTNRLASLDCIRSNAASDGNIQLTPTYIGIVRSTEGTQSEWQALVSKLIEDWETTSVEFKEALHLARDKEKAEFVRDILALATTKSSGKKFLIIGFSDKTHEFAQSVHPGIAQERLKQILHAYTEPTPEVLYRTVGWEDGTIGVIEAVRDPAKIPYRASKSLGGQIEAGKVYVRHGTHVEEPSAAELPALEAEGQAAREAAASAR